MSNFSFAEHIGAPICIATRTAFAVKAENPFWIGALLLGSDPGGLWIKPDQGYFHEEILWDFELKEGGPSAVGSWECCCFIPSSEIRYVQVFWARSGEGI